MIYQTNTFIGSKELYLERIKNNNFYKKIKECVKENKSFLDFNDYRDYPALLKSTDKYIRWIIPRRHGSRGFQKTELYWSYRKSTKKEIEKYKQYIKAWKLMKR